MFLQDTRIALETSSRTEAVLYTPNFSLCLRLFCWYIQILVAHYLQKHWHRPQKPRQTVSACCRKQLDYRPIQGSHLTHRLPGEKVTNALSVIFSHFHLKGPLDLFAGYEKFASMVIFGGQSVCERMVLETSNLFWSPMTIWDSSTTHPHTGCPPKITVQAKHAPVTLERGYIIHQHTCV